MLAAYLTPDSAAGLVVIGAITLIGVVAFVRRERLDTSMFRIRPTDDELLWQVLSEDGDSLHVDTEAGCQRWVREHAARRRVGPR